MAASGGRVPLRRSSAGLDVPPLVYELLLTSSSINVVLVVFNLIPIPPLDGSKLLFGFIRPQHGLADAGRSSSSTGSSSCSRVIFLRSSPAHSGSPDHADVAPTSCRGAAKVRQFRRAPARPGRRPASATALATWLTPPRSSALFDAMHVADRRHGLDVVATLRARRAQADADLLLAGLLHDAGKGDTGCGRALPIRSGRRTGRGSGASPALLPGCPRRPAPAAGPRRDVGATRGGRGLLAADRRADPLAGRAARPATRASGCAWRTRRTDDLETRRVVDDPEHPSAVRRGSPAGRHARRTSSSPSSTGPLGLLLSLIEARQLDVLTVPLGDLAEAYLEALASLDDDRLGNVSSFVAVASQLILIKSRAMLPRRAEPPAGLLPEEEPDPEAELRAPAPPLPRATATPARAARRGRGSRSRAVPARARGGRGRRPRGRAARRRPPLDPRSSSRALDGLARIVPAARAAARGHRRARSRSTERAAVIRAAIRGAARGPSCSRSCCADVRDRVVVAVTFLAMLELMKRREIVVEQDEPWGPIVARATTPDERTGATAADRR